MTDYRIEAASREEWAERALRAEAEVERLRELIPNPDQTDDESIWRDYMRGVSIATLAKEYKVTRERMRHRIKRIAKHVVALKGEPK